jgi:uncharacterized membrane protein
MTTANPDFNLGNILSTGSNLTLKEHWDHIQARLGIRRKKHRVAPGLYALGSPTPESPVFVSANYTLSFDELRSNLSGMDAYILVLNTHGINVWCAAGKGTFGTAEIIKQVSETGLSGIVKHRRLIAPQLGAPGVAAHEVKQATGFTVEYGPVRAADLPEYMKTHKATPEMRRVNFTLRDRLVLIPVEITLSLGTFLISAIVFYFLGGIRAALAVMMVMFAGLVLFPILLPWLPARDFSVKGIFLGILSAAPFAVSVFTQNPDWNWYRQAIQALSFPLLMAPAIAFLSLNFTGSSTFTSRLGVKREINSYIPIMAWTFCAGLVTMILGIFIR